MILPQIIYLQTTTQCNGHCEYCPFDETYGLDDPVDMSLDMYLEIIEWMSDNNYKGRLGFLLHYEPTMDNRLEEFVKYARAILPDVKLETATNDIIKSPVLKMFDTVSTTPANSLTAATSRAGNVLSCDQIKGRHTLREAPCPIPNETMCIAANGDVLLCCQDWRHEAIVGYFDDLTTAREVQLEYLKKSHNNELEICRDCLAGKTAEEVGEKLGVRFIC